MTTTPDPVPAEDILSIRSASSEDEFYYQWSLENRKRNATLTSEILRQMVTLSSALLAGSIVVLKDMPLPVFFRVLTPLAFLGALVVSVFGMMPYDVKAHPDQPTVFRLGLDQGLAWKTKLLWAAATAIGVGFVAALLGLVFG